MADSYRNQAAMDADKAALGHLHAVLNAAKASLRLDDYRLWTIRGRGQNYISTWGDGVGWLLYLQCRSGLAWTWAKKRLAFCTVTQDGDDEGVLRLDRLPTPEEAVEIRDLIGIRQTHAAPPNAFVSSPAEMAL